MGACHLLSTPFTRSSFPFSHAKEQIICWLESLKQSDFVRATIQSFPSSSFLVSCGMFIGHNIDEPNKAYRLGGEIRHIFIYLLCCYSE